MVKKDARNCDSLSRCCARLRRHDAGPPSHPPAGGPGPAELSVLARRPGAVRPRRAPVPARGRRATPHRPLAVREPLVRQPRTALRPGCLLVLWRGAGGGGRGPPGRPPRHGAHPHPCPTGPGPPGVAPPGGERRGARRSPGLGCLLALPLPGVPAGARRLPLRLGGFGSLFLQAPRMATPWGLPSSFGGAGSAVRLWLGEAADLVEPISLVALVLCVVAPVAGIVAALVSSDARQRRMGRVALIAWIGNVLLLAAVGLERHPHYNFSSAWVPVFGVAS